MADSLKELRAEIKRRRAAATRKVARLRREKNIYVLGSDLDVRRAPGVESNYNRRQLRAYLNELNTFTSRDTQFVRGSGGAPIRKTTWAKLQTTARRRNEYMKRQTAPIDHTPFPGMSGMTWRQVESIEAPWSATRRGANPNSIFGERNIDPDPSALTGERAAQALTDLLGRQMSKREIARQGQIGRNAAVKMAAEYGNHELTEAIAGLNDRQMALIWGMGTFRDTLKGYYISALEGGDDSDDFSSEALEIVGWARGLKF